MNITLKFAAIAFACVLTTALLGAEATARQNPAATPFATKATVVVKSDDAVIPLKREEQIAFMFVDAIKSLLDDCGRHAAEPCTLEALVRGPKPKDDWGMGKLKFDPNASDPNYTYTVTLSGRNWEIRADPRKPGLGGFFTKGPSFGGRWYNPAGPATQSHTKITGSSVEGDLFNVQ
jgi:hypothetical protein